jgi:PhzF family phenazine biosynthesis protein
MELMKSYRLYQVDSFTKEKLSGNPAGVIADADGLSEQQMQKIARELNHSETAFLFSPTGPGYDVEVRFFTPTKEVPICGHATIAAHYVRAMEKKLDTGTVLQKTGAGILPVDLVRQGDDYSVVMTQGQVSVGEPLPDAVVGRIAEGLGISTQDLREDCPVCIASTGHSKVMVGIRSNDLLHRLSPNMDRLARLSAEIGCNGYYVFTLNPGEEILVHGRMFAPAIGIPEDPVTGNANGPLGAYLVQHGLFQIPGEGPFSFTAMQGEAIGRTGTMKVSVTKQEGRPALVQIMGEAVIVFSTELML